jgi:hypothetical protein
VNFEQALAKKFGKDATAAEWLSGLCRKRPHLVQPSKKVPSVTSLATKIGDLRRGAAPAIVWWQRRPNLLKALAGRLEIPAEDIVAQAPTAGGSLDFPEFPGLEPIGRGELPCLTWGSGWLGDVAIRDLDPAGERRWIVAPAGWGKSLLIHFLQARHASEYVAFSVSTLAAVDSDSSPGKTLVVEVDESGDDAAEEARRMRARRGSVVVLAPFEPPPGPAPQDGGWKVLAVPASTDWRRRMLDWIDTRLDPADVRATGFSPEAALEWLSRRDPLGVAIASPGDLLAFCAELDRSGEPEGWGSCASKWLQRFAARPGEGPARSWSSNAGARAFTATLKRQLDYPAAVPGAAATATWETFMDPAGAPAAEGDTTGALVAIGYLRELGLLRGGLTGLEAYPRWVGRGVLFHSLTRDLRDRTPSEWGALAADDARQEIVDGALDELGREDFLAAVRRVADTAKPSTLAEVGAVEATFAAAARRLRTPGFELPAADVTAWQRLAALQLGTLVPHPAWAGLHQPFTRRRVEEWLLNGWGFALNVARPRRLPDRKFAWELPGWFDALDASKAPALPWPRTFHGMGHDAADLIFRVAALVTPATLGDDDLALLMPALLTAPADTTWRLRGAHLNLLHSAWEPTALEHLIDVVPPVRWPAVAERVWAVSPDAMKLRNWSSYTVGDRIAFLERDYGPLARKVLTNLPWESVENTIARDGFLPTSAPVTTLGALPRELVHRALSAWLDRPAERPTKWAEAQDLAPLLRRGDKELLAKLIQRADRETAAELCKVVWRLDAELGLGESAHALEQGLPSAESWFVAAPRAEIPALAAQLEHCRKSAPTWVRRWAFQRALEAGTAREQLYAWAKS